MSNFLDRLKQNQDSEDATLQGRLKKGQGWPVKLWADESIGSLDIDSLNAGRDLKMIWGARGSES